MPAAAQTVSHPQFWKSTFEDHSPSVLAFLVSRLGRRDVAEDLLQETFARAIRAGALRDGAKARSYLLTIASRLIVDRTRRSRPVLFSELADGTYDADGSIPDAAQPSPVEAVEMGRARERLEEAVAALSEPLRRAFVAAVLEQKPYAEIAADNDWTSGQVRVNVHRARKQVIETMRGLLQLDAGEQP